MIIPKRKYPFRLMLVSALAATTIASALSVDVAESTIAETEDGVDAATDDDDYYFYIPHEGNSTLSATFSIRVTPEHYYIVSWTILWVCFAISVIFGLYQLKLERRWIKYSIMNSMSSSSDKSSSKYKRKYPVGSPSDPELGGGRKNFTTIGGRRVISSSRGRMAGSSSSASIQSSSGAAGDEQQTSVISSGDLARGKFRRLILFAMASRTIAIPIQIYSDPLWIQLIADTFPVMAFATSWMWLVSFFIQLVGVAMGTNINANLGSGSAANTSGPGGGPNSSSNPSATIDTVIQITAYSIYGLLIIAFSVFGRIASAVLLYALLCCVYATLLGMGMYFLPRLLGLVLPALRGKWQSPLALRLAACTSICLLVFGAQTFSFARKVVQSTAPQSQKLNGPYWWFQYGALELVPGFLFLVLLHPKLVPRMPLPDDSSASAKSIGDASSAAARGRLGSNDSKSGSGRPPHSPQPSRSTTPIPQRQMMSVPSGTKESTPLLSSNNPNLRYGGPVTMGGPVDIEQQGSGDRSIP